ncbi:MAG: phage integrase SAM-like domain-containing protein [Bacteroidota bacterium]|uniref:Site-specific integrase n=1 Tax=Pedobacter cryotolerans TaxID=2571270 RepID=A0A4U1C322_9SPHI|nr:site-specific integrase [Pedobacter cryotolerans]TKB98449.1 site-specific integrase [Pedobacter cryotolerans]
MKSNQALKILFWHRKSKADSKCFAPIICRISIDGKDVEFSTSQKVHIEDWNVETKKVIRSTDSKKINTALNHIESSLEVNFTVLKTQYDCVSPLMLKNAFQNLPIENKKDKGKKTEQKTPSLLELTEGHIKDFCELVEKKLRSKETLKQWKATQKKIAEFLKFEFKVDDCDLSAIEYSFAQKFYKYLAVKRTPVLGDSAAMKQIKNTKQLLSLAETNNWISKNPIEKFRCGSEDPEIIPLEVFEVEKLWRKKISIDRLAKVRDAFIFQCFTGFAYQDIYNLSNEHIKYVGAENEPWLVKERGKTKVTEMVPVLPIVAELIEKYKNHPYCKVYNRLIPVNSNFRYNSYLKELSDICNIGRSLNSHLARHTFADMMLNVLNFSLEDVSKMLGHKNIRTTQRYARVKKSRIGKKMNESKSILFDKKGELRNTFQ